MLDPKTLTPMSCLWRATMKAWMAGLLMLTLAFLLVACDAALPTPTPVAQPAAGGLNASAAAAPAPDEPQAAPVAMPIPPATPTPEPPSGHVVLWHSWAGRDGDALSAALTDLAARAPNLVVETLFVAPDELPQAYADAVRNGGGPDLVATASWWLDDMIAAGVVSPIEGGLALQNQQDYFPAALQTLQRQGVTFGLPTDFETVALFWNKNLATSDQLPATTADLLTQAQSAPSLGLGLYANLYHVWWGFPAYSAQLFDPQGRVILEQNSGPAEFLTWMKTLNETPGSFVDDDYGMLLDRFKKGEFAFFVDGPWAAADLRSALGDSLSVTRLPAGPVGPAQPWLNTNGLFINPNLNGDQQVLALAVAEELTGPQVASRFSEIAGWLPANRKAALPNDAIIAGFMEQATTAQPAPTNPEMEQVWGYAGDMVIKVLTGVADPAAAVVEASALINEANGK